MQAIFVGTPASPGMDFSGRVVRCGTGVKDFKPGQLVYGDIGTTQFGSLAEYLVARVDQVAPLPAGLDTDYAATLGIAGQTAYQSIVPYITPGKGDKVFITAGSGGVGIFGIQIAKQLGCYVTTTCSSRNIQFCKDLGADEVIDYTKQDVVKTLREKGPVYRVTVDLVGGSPPNLYRDSHYYMTNDGTFVQVGANSMSVFPRRVIQSSFLGSGKTKFKILAFKTSKMQLVELGQWVLEGKLKVLIDSTFDFEDVVKAFEKLKTSRARGKIIIHVSSKN